MPAAYSPAEVSVVDVDLAGHTVLVSYRPIGVALACVGDFDPDVDEELVQLACTLIDSWDVEDGGVVVPIRDTTLAKVPPALLWRLVRAVLDDAKQRR